jgi:hypothetical protein
MHWVFRVSRHSISLTYKLAKFCVWRIIIFERFFACGDLCGQPLG